MKKLVLTLLLMALVFTGIANAAGSSVTVTQYLLSHDKRVLVIKLSCVGDDGTGAVAATAIDTATASVGLEKIYPNIGFYLYEVWSIGGTTLPDAADLTITDALGSVLFDQDNVIAASTTPSEGTVDKAKAVTSILTMTVANQATVSATWDVYIKLVR